MRQHGNGDWSNMTDTKLLLTRSPQPPQPFYGPFSGITRVSQCKKRTSRLYGAREDNTGRHTNHPAGRHSIRTYQCPPPPSPHIFYRPDALPATQPTVSKHWRLLFTRSCNKKPINCKCHMHIVLTAISGEPPPQLTCVCALAGKMGNTKIAFFTQMPEFNQSRLDFFNLFDSRLILTLLYDFQIL